MHRLSTRATRVMHDPNAVKEVHPSRILRWPQTLAISRVYRITCESTQITAFRLQSGVRALSGGRVPAEQSFHCRSCGQA